MITALLGFVFDNPLGKWLVGGLGLAALVQTWIWTHDAKVVGQVHAASKIEGEKKNAKSDHAYERADRPGAFERLRKSACPDCGK